jgi:hypothetical protein
MRLKPRHYVLFLVIVAVFVWNIVRNHHRQPALQPAPAPIVHTGPPPQSPGWSAFDAAANLRDAPEAQFQPALKSLQDLLPADPNHADIKGCLIWLQYYRQGMAQTRTDPQMKDRAIHHIDGCTHYHLDTTSN